MLYHTIMMRTQRKYRTSTTVAAVKRMEQEVSEACKESNKVKELLKESAVMLNLAYSSNI